MASGDCRGRRERRTLTVREFEDVAARALESLPPRLQAAIDNVAVVVEDENREDPDIYGLYVGVPLTERTAEGYAGSLPDQIEIYRRPLVADFGDDIGELTHQIRVTVLHELAHHFGIDDDRLLELGWD